MVKMSNDCTLYPLICHTQPHSASLKMHSDDICRTLRRDFALLWAAVAAIIGARAKNTPALYSMHTDPTGKKVTRCTATAAFMVRKAGVRMTRQRRAVIEVLLQSYDHPTAAQIYERAKDILPGISLATVYNCIETLAAEKLINQLHFDNGPCRFCPNVEPHMHVLDDATNRVIDVQLKEGVTPEDVFELPEGVHIKSMEAYLRGEIPDNCMSDIKQ